VPTPIGTGHLSLRRRALVVIPNPDRISPDAIVGGRRVRPQDQEETLALARFQLIRMPDSSVIWRFMASNNREIARAALPTDDEWTARSNILALQSGLAGATSAPFLDRSGRWRWDVKVEGVALAASSRAYYRRVECETTRRQFMEAAGRAPAPDLVASSRAIGTVPVVPLVAVVPGQRSVVPVVVV
jgi:hypothetical protein